LGWTGVSNPNDDPFGFYYNPAMLGYSSQHTSLSVQFYPSKVDWLGLGYTDFTSNAINLGYNFKNELNGLNLSAGIGFIHNRLDYHLFQPSDGFDKYDAYSIGVGLDYFVLLSLGISLKDIHSELSDRPNGEESSKGIADINAIDYGVLLSIPIIKLIDENFSIPINDESKFKPSLNYSVGYSRLNIGDEVYYVDPAQADPIPLTARLGHTIGIGINFITKDFNIKLISYDLILEAEDLLVIRDTLGNSTYQGMLGDIDIWKNLIQLKGDDNVVVHKGHAIEFLETVTLLKGSFVSGFGRGYSYVPKSDGLIISTNGLLKWLNSQLETDLTKFLSNHIELKYLSSTNFKEMLDTDFSGVSLAFKNYHF
jgi:hypothetical protein